jgi:ketosteroid isomerase-like protein
MAQTRELIEAVRGAFESGDFGRFPELVAPGAEVRSPFTTVQGPAAFAELGARFAAACSDRRLEILRLVEAGDAAVAEIRVTARHTGPLPVPDGEAPATGNAIAFDEADVVRVQGGRIASWHAYYDGLAFSRQVGLVPPRT